MTIKTSRQLKDKIRNLAREKTADAQLLMRRYMMERFLERLVQSRYRKNFILKGGVLIASMIGIEARSTMDLDGTMDGLPVNLPEAEKMINEIISIPLEDGVRFQIENTDYIMEEMDYPGVRIRLKAFFDGTVIPLQVDISAGDIVTPGPVIHSYKLMFEDRHIPVKAYNLETVLAEKLEAIIRHHIANTRMRDFYDIYILKKTFEEEISKDVLSAAVKETVRWRGSQNQMRQAKTALSEIEESQDMQDLWFSYQSHYHYARAAGWHGVMKAVFEICPDGS